MIKGSSNQLKAKNLYNIITNERLSEEEMCNNIASAIAANPICLNKKDRHSGNSILHLAIYHELPKVAHFLIEKGCNIDLQNNLGQTPLHWAIERWHDIVEKNKGKIDLAETQFHSAIEKQYETVIDLKQRSFYWVYKTVDLLIKRKCGLTLNDNFNEGPLHVAAKNNAAEIIKLLINNNYPLTIQNNRGETPLHLAASSQGAVTLLILCRQQEVKNHINTVDMKLETALHKAVRSGSLECIKILLTQSSLNKDIVNDEEYTAEKLIFSLEHGNKQELLEAFKVVPIRSNLHPEFENELFRIPEIIDHKEDIKELQKKFKALNIEYPLYNFSSNDKELRLDIELNEEDFLFGRRTKIESYLLKGGDPNAMVSPNDYSLLYCAFIYKQVSIFLTLVRAGATLAEENLIKKIESIMSNEENATHAGFIYEVRQQLFGSAEAELKSCQKEIQLASSKFEHTLREHGLFRWFYEQDIITKPSKKQLKNLTDPDLKNCMLALYDLCSGKIEKKETWKESDDDSFVRNFDNLHIKQCVPGLLDQFEPNLILDSLITFKSFNPKNIQLLICLYILKEVIILNLEFRYILDEKFPDKLEGYLQINYDNELGNAFRAVYQATNKLKNSPIYSSYCELGKLLYKYPSEQGTSIIKQIRNIIKQDPQKFSKKDIENFDNFTKFLANQIRILSLQFLEVTDSKEFRKNVWAHQKEGREVNAPNLVIYENRLNALTTFVYSQVDQKNELHRWNAFTLFTHAANACLSLSHDHEIGPDINSLVGIMGGLNRHSKRCLPHVDKNTNEIYKQLSKLCCGDKNYEDIRKLLASYVFSFPFLMTFVRDKLTLMEQRQFNNAHALSIIGKLYSPFRYINSKVVFLQKNYSTDLLFLLSTIEPRVSVKEEIKESSEPQEERKEMLLLTFPNMQTHKEHSQENLEETNNTNQLLTMSLFPHTSRSHSSYSHSHSSENLSNTPSASYIILDQSNLKEESHSEEKDKEKSENNDNLLHTSETLTLNYNSRKKRRSRSINRIPTMETITNALFSKNKYKN